MTLMNDIYSHIRKSANNDVCVLLEDGAYIVLNRSNISRYNPVPLGDRISIVGQIVGEKDVYYGHR